MLWLKIQRRFLSLMPQCDNTALSEGMQKEKINATECRNLMTAQEKVARFLTF